MTIGLAVIVSFIVNLYVFPFVVELLFIPFVVAVATTLAFTEMQKDANPEYAEVARILNRILVIVGLGVLAFASLHAIFDVEHLVGVQSLQDALLPPILTLAFVPFVWAVALYAGYEQLFLRTSMALRRDARLARRAKREFVRACGLRPARLARFVRYASRRVWSVSNDADLDGLLRDFPDAAMGGDGWTE